MIASASRHRRGPPRLLASISAAALLYAAARPTLHADTDIDTDQPASNHASSSRLKLTPGSRVAASGRAHHNNSLLVWGYNQWVTRRTYCLVSSQPETISLPPGRKTLSNSRLPLPSSPQTLPFAAYHSTRTMLHALTQEETCTNGALLSHPRLKRH